VSVWGLERARLLRTPRWAAIAGPYLLFGIAMPIVTRYQEVLLRHVGGGITVIAPRATPAQGIASYLQNAMQIGLVVSVLVAAGSLAFDARPEWAAFLRTRAVGIGALLVPKVVTSATAIASSFAVGLAAAWVGTRALIGPVPVASLLGGIAFGALYLVFVVSLVAFAASVSRSAIGSAGIAIVVLIVLPLLGGLRMFGPWVPSALVGAPTALARGEAVASFGRAAVVTAFGAVVLVWLSARILARREV
jgi:ABC-2 type transport system permease protein